MSKPPKLPRDAGLKAAIAAIGSIRELAFLLGITPAAIHEWHRVPTHRIKQVEAVTGVPRGELRPDLYRGTRFERSEGEPAP